MGGERKGEKERQRERERDRESERDRDREREKREREKREISIWEGNLDQLVAHTDDRTCNLGMCPDWQSNLQPFGVQDDAPAEPPSQGYC